jgi:hypothetical protein
MLAFGDVQPAVPDGLGVRERRHAEQAVDVAAPAFIDRREEDAGSIRDELRGDPAPACGAAHLPVAARLPSAGGFGEELEHEGGVLVAPDEELLERGRLHDSCEAVQCRPTRGHAKP